MFLLQSELRWGIQIAATFCYLNPTRRDKSSPGRVNVVHQVAAAEKPAICTADELHYVSVPNSDWRLALWRYKPPPKAPTRHHPLLLLCGVGTNAIGYDLAPEASFARSMSSQGFDTWILEFRGAGLSADSASKKFKQSTNVAMTHNSSIKFKGNGSLEPGQNSALPIQARDLSERLVNMFEEGHRSVSQPITELLERFSMTIEELQNQIESIVIYNWDFDHYLEEDVPTAMEYIIAQCKPKDGKLMAVGHSMGGILLYAMLSRNSSEGRDSKLAAIITLGSSLDYTTSKSVLKLLIPLADPAEVLRFPVVPLGALLAAAYPLASRPPYVMSWVNYLITAQDMVNSESMEKFILKNFCTIPAKLLLQLSTAFRDGGLRDRSRKFLYKDHLRKINVPVLAIAGDRDLICPPDAVYETVKLIPDHIVTYKVFGGPDGPHYAHYDLVGGSLAAEQLYPVIVEFLSYQDSTS